MTFRILQILAHLWFLKKDQKIEDNWRSQFEEPSSEHERKASITGFPTSRRESVFSKLGNLAHSRTELERKAEAHDLILQENYPAYQLSTIKIQE